MVSIASFLRLSAARQRRSLAASRESCVVAGTPRDPEARPGPRAAAPVPSETLQMLSPAAGAPRLNISAGQLDSTAGAGRRNERKRPA
ncbi:hypothetical protein EVAR_83266_1 [Eumeta japonica]|uniref:Uncharacterized protein n=1 Tax=Eumeta variegata TaxID=151549 RepID=A0A4C1XB75_EUMVA|nr:hypothetical protein EVAR_83266_1 [Eumeta japonica]